MSNGNSPEGAICADLDEQMRVFDSLPRALREFLAEQPIDYDAVGVSHYYHRHRIDHSTVAIIEALRKRSEKLVSEMRARDYEGVL